MPGTADTFTTSNRLSKQPTGGNYNEWGVFLNDNMDLVDTAIDGNKIITLSSTSYTLSVANGATDEARFASLSFIGSPGGTATVTANAAMKLRDIENRTTGGFPIVFTNGTGSSVTILNNSFVRVQCDMSGNMRTVAGNQMGGRRVTGLAAGTATDDAVRLDQLSIVSGRTVTVGGTASQILVNYGGTSSTSYGWGDGLLQGLQTISVPAGAMESPSTNSASSTVLYMTTSSRPVRSMVFNGTAVSDAYATIEGMPKSWDRGSLYVGVIGFTTGTSSGQVVYELAAADMPPAVTIDQAFSTATSSIVSAVGGEYIASYSTGIYVPMPDSGTAADQASVSLRIRRNSTSASDTLTDNFFVTGLKVLYEVNRPNDDL
jgi:hypothetical protein